MVRGDPVIAANNSWSCLGDVLKELRVAREQQADGLARLKGLEEQVLREIG